MAPSLLSCFSVVSMSWFTFAIVSILCCGPLTCFLLAMSLPTIVYMYSCFQSIFIGMSISDSGIFVDIHLNDYVTDPYLLVITCEQTS